MIRRRKPLTRSTKPIQRTALARSSKPIPKRRKGKARRGPADIPADEFRCKPFKDFLTAEGKCSACASLIRDHGRLEQLRPGVLAGYCDPAHGPVLGGSMKGPDSGCIPLCRGFGLLNHHDEQHKIGWPAFERKYSIDRAAEARAWWVLFRLLTS